MYVEGFIPSYEEEWAYAVEDSLKLMQPELC